KPNDGEVSIGDFTVNCKRTAKKDVLALRQKTAMVFQQYNLFKHKTALENVMEGLVVVRKVKHEEAKKISIEVLEKVGLGEKLDHYPSQLSGGQQQRVGIARALASNPSILLCDEATSALDPQTTQSILDLLRKINKEYKITILIITHEMSVIQRICNKVAVMEKGEIIEQGNVLEVFGQPQHPTTQSFVRTVIHDTVPDSVLQTFEQQEAQRIYKLEFIGQAASGPVVHELIRHHEVYVNILFANMTEIQETTIGYMTIQVRGEEHAVQQAVDFIKSRGVNIQEVKAI
ncbi:ATP-binding cassette domain-containing protein, partial [Paenibacillus sp. 28ISP30-2]|nr:ATP-binding cassette domain-containing protein [Paenibacillus sp. 28ISP30-2]